MTTVGYGDVSPETTLGRAIAIILMLVGIGFVAVLTAALAERFVRSEIAEVEEEVEDAVAVGTEAMLAEVREIAERLQRLEAAIRVRLS